MNDKAFERAKQIKQDLLYLDLVKNTLRKSINISIDLSRIESVRQPFIDAVDGLIAQLKQEYENL